MPPSTPGAAPSQGSAPDGTLSARARLFAPTAAVRTAVLRSSGRAERISCIPAPNGRSRCTLLSLSSLKL